MNRDGKWCLQLQGRSGGKGGEINEQGLEAGGVLLLKGSVGYLCWSGSGVWVLCNYHKSRDNWNLKVWLETKQTSPAWYFSTFFSKVLKSPEGNNFMILWAKSMGWGAWFPLLSFAVDEPELFLPNAVFSKNPQVPSNLLIVSLWSSSLRWSMLISLWCVNFLGAEAQRWQDLTGSVLPPFGQDG